jgi:hypothetical protein
MKEDPMKVGPMSQQIGYSLEIASGVSLGQELRDAVEK